MTITKNLICFFLALFIISSDLQAQECDNLRWDFQVVSSPLHVGEQFFIECYVSDFENVATFQYTISFDQNVIAFSDLDCTGSPLIGQVFGNFSPEIVNSGNIPILWTNGNGEGQTLPQNTPIFKMFFEVVGQRDNCSYFEINSSQIDAEISFELADGSLCIIRDNINFVLTNGDLCIECDNDLFISTNLCQGNLDFSVCGGTEPYSYTLEGPLGLLDQGIINEGDNISYENLEEGFYIISASDATGVSMSVDLNNAFLEAPILFTDPMCTGEAAFLSTSDFYSSYSWFGPEGNIIAAEDSDEPWLIKITEGGTYTLTTSHNGCTQSSEYFWEQDDIILSTVEGFSVCNSSTSGDPTVVDLNELILDAPGSYNIFFNGSLVVNNVYDFEGSTAGFNTFLIILDTIGPCPSASFELEIEVIECGCPELALIPIGDFCNNNQVNINLFNFLSSGTDQMGSFEIITNLGEFADIQPNVNGELLIDTNFESGFYFVVYTLDNPTEECEESATSTFFIYENPSPQATAPGPVCNSDVFGDNTIIDLSELIDWDEGIWEDESGSPINNTVIDFNGQAAGIYNFTYTSTDAQAPCSNVSVSLAVQVINCSCPELILNALPGFCNSSETTVQLFDFLSLETSQEGSFKILKSEGDLADIQPDVNGLLLIDENFEKGFYTAKYTLDISTVGCPDSDNQPIAVSQEPQLQIFQPEPVCNSDTLGAVTSLDLSTFVLGATGIWEDESSNALNTTNQEFNGETPGIYIYTFTTTDAIAPCNNVSMVLEVEVIDCAISSTKEIENTILNIFPNPSSGSVNIELNEKMQVQIFDVSGRNILKAKLEVGTNLLQLEGQEKGVYLMEFYNEGKFYGVRKLLIH